MIRRGFVPIKKNYLGVQIFSKLSDGFCLKRVESLLNSYSRYRQDCITINGQINKGHRKIRNPNFPSPISENIVKFAIREKYGVCPSWNTESGDLEFAGKRIEVKGFSSDGPISFGPTQRWDILYLVDCRNYNKMLFSVIEIRLTNFDVRSLVLNSKNGKTYGDYCDVGKRPILKPEKLLSIIEEKKTIFNGHLDELNQ